MPSRRARQLWLHPTSSSPARKRRGLYVYASPKGGEWWRLKYSFEGKARLPSLRTYPDTGLKAVHDRRDQARRLIAQGVVSSAARKAEKARRLAVDVNSFETVACEWHTTIHLGQVSERHASRTLMRLERERHSARRSSVATGPCDPAQTADANGA